MHILKTPRNQLLLALQIIFLWHVVWIWLKITSFKRVVKRIGLQEDQLLPQINAKQEEKLRSIRSIYLATQKRWPWKFKCLINTLVCSILLTNEYIPFNLYLGVTSKSDHPMEAHSWIKSNGWYITEEKKDAHTMVSTFTPLLH